jgi:hypothetical protein
VYLNNRISSKLSSSKREVHILHAMSPKDHNKTLGIIYSFLGGLLVVAALVELVRIITIENERSRVLSNSYVSGLIIIGLLLTIVLLATAYGLFKGRRWARVFSLILSGLFVWLFPLGTALAVYTWWFMHSEGGKELYSKSHAGNFPTG